MLKTVYKCIDKVRSFAIISILAFIVLLGMTQIFLRYLTPASLKPFPWGDEIMRLLNMWVVFLAASLGAKENTHLSMDYFLRKMFSEKIIRIIRKLTSILVIACLLLLIWYGAVRMLANTTAMLQNIAIPISYFYAAIPVGCAYLLVDYLLILIYGEHPFSRKNSGEGGGE